MRYRIVYLQPFYDNLSDIRAYLDQYTTTAFDALQQRFFDMIEQIEKTPRMFQAYGGLKTHHDLRRAVVGNFQVFYVVEDDLHLVTALNILHTAQDIGKRLRMQLASQWIQSICMRGRTPEGERRIAPCGVPPTRRSVRLNSARKTAFAR